MISKQKTMIQSYVNNLLNQIIDKNQIDFVRDFASHIPGHIICRVCEISLGIQQSASRRI